MAVLRILHLAGSPTDSVYADLSALYATGCIDALQDAAQYEFVIALITPDGFWRFPAALSKDAASSAEPMALADAVAFLANAAIDACVPHLFCKAGMTHFRALLDILEIPYLGNRPLQMALAADKAMTRHIVGAAGVCVPAAELVRRGDRPMALSLPLSLSLPVVVKPNDSDNSDGLSLVRSTDDYPAALDLALSFSDSALVEAFIPLGREVRCGIVVEAGQLRLLPLEEYRLDAVTRPVRTHADKLKRDDQQALVFAAKDASQSWIVPTDDPITPTVWEAARRCHVALGCEQYSLFDFRIDPDGRPWFLEAGLYCSFSPKSVIVSMMAAAGTPLSVFFRSAVDAVMERHASRALSADQ